MVKDDYAALVSDVQALVDKVGDINILLDLTDFHWEKISAWGADLKFGDRALIAALEGASLVLHSVRAAV